jgi:hypothetical protein
MLLYTLPFAAGIVAVSMSHLSWRKSALARVISSLLLFPLTWVMVYSFGNHLCDQGGRARLHFGNCCGVRDGDTLVAVAVILVSTAGRRHPNSTWDVHDFDVGFILPRRRRHCESGIQRWALLAYVYKWAVSTEHSNGRAPGA